MKKLILVLILTIFLPAYLLAQEEPGDSSRKAAEKKLLAQVESFKKTVSRIRGKEFVEEFKIGIKTKDELRKLILERTEKDDDLKEFEKARKFLVKLGLVEPEFDIRKAMTEMLTEQVAGFYDPETKELHLMEKTAAGQMPGMVVAHEMFHVLQDQYFHINAMKQVIHENDDRAMATMGIIEGEATLGGLEYEFEKQGMTLFAVPGDLGAFARMQFEMQLKMQPNSVMAKTPRFIREMLMFQYCEGSSFVQKFLQKHKSWKKIDSLFENPPLSTEQIMHPEKYLGEIDYPVRIHLPELHKRLEGGWEEITTGNMGEFLLKVFLSEFIDGKTAAAAATGWDGDSYTMIESKEKGGPQIIAWLSVWDSEKDAREFAEAYAGALGKRFKTKAQKLDTGFFLHVEDDKETVLIELAGTQALVIQGAPVLLIPEVRSLVLKARQVEMKERGFDDLAGQKPDLPGPPAKGEADPDEEQEEKEPAKRDF